MTGPPENETPGPGVVTGPSVEMEMSGLAVSGTEHSSNTANSPASNVVPFRRPSDERAHPYEIVEIYLYTLFPPRQLWVALAGPVAPDRSGRKPWHKVAIFDYSDAPAAAEYARALAAEYGVRIEDLAKIMPPEGGPEAA